jgi:SNF family Na+-dependent transporter
MLPLGGFSVAILIGWVMPEKFLKENLMLRKNFFRWFYFSLKFVAPISIILIFLYSVF